MDQLSIARHVERHWWSSVFQNAAKAILCGFLALTTLPGCGVNDFPCDAVMDDRQLLNMVEFMGRYHDLHLDKSDAVVGCNFIWPGQDQDGHDCCWWIADEIYGVVDSDAWRM